MCVALALTGFCRLTRPSCPAIDWPNRRHPFALVTPRPPCATRKWPTASLPTRGSSAGRSAIPFRASSVAGNPHLSIHSLFSFGEITALSCTNGGWRTRRMHTSYEGHHANSPILKRLFACGRLCCLNRRCRASNLSNTTRRDQFGQCWRGFGHTDGGVLGKRACGDKQSSHGE